MSFKINDGIILDGDALYINDTKVTTKIFLNEILIWSPKEGGGMINIIAGNFKMNGTTVEQNRVFLDYYKGISVTPDKELVVFPQTLLTQDTIEYLKGYNISVGLQVGSSVGSGAYTGQNSMALAKSLGCKYVLVNNDEVVNYSNLSLKEANARVLQAINVGLIPIVTCFEDLTEREVGAWKYWIPYQLLKLLNNVPRDRDFVICYTPVWAIGTGKTASVADIEITTVLIRQTLRELNADSANIPILYGGSINPSNAAEFSGGAGVNGALVGGASIKADINGIYKNWLAQ